MLPKGLLAQGINGCTFQAQAGTYAPLSGGTRLATLETDEALDDALLGFTFSVGGKFYTDSVVSSSGWLCLGIPLRSGAQPSSGFFFESEAGAPSCQRCGPAPRRCRPPRLTAPLAGSLQFATNPGSFSLSSCNPSVSGLPDTWYYFVVAANQEVRFTPAFDGKIEVLGTNCANLISAGQCISAAANMSVHYQLQGLQCGTSHLMRVNRADMYRQPASQSILHPRNHAAADRTGQR
jgi:hypothetical protein